MTSYYGMAKYLCTYTGIVVHLEARPKSCATTTQWEILILRFF